MHDRLAFVFESEFDGMVKLARVFLGASPEAEDVVMTAFVRLADRIDGLERPGGWLRTTVVNECRRRLRDQSRRRRIWSERVVPSSRGGVSNASDEYVDDLLVDLSDRERVAIVLTYYLDYSHEEIAVVLGCRRGTVKSLIHRALKKMRVMVAT
jgi:RNA polymerase sigma factor (sigma-70 family)